MNTVTIKRVYEVNATVGEVTARVGGMTFTCKSLELPWLNNQQNISCIPVGRYDVKPTFSSKFMKYTYEVLKVPNRTGIRIHSANYTSQILGCIALGATLVDMNEDGIIDTTSSKDTIARFEAFMKKEPFQLEIY